MSLATDRTNLARLNKDISDLRAKEAKEAKNAAEAQKRIASANASASRASSPSSAKSYLSTAEREGRNLTTAQTNQAKYATQAASKNKDAARLQEKITKEEEAERKKTAAADDRRRRDEDARRRTETQQQQRREAAAARANSELQQRIRDLEAQMSEQMEAQASNTPAFVPTAPPGEEEVYDVFISHAWEDKEDFVKELATKARDAGIKVWYDKFSLQWGDSIRQKIDAGLASSYFGIAVLSPFFFAKPWTQYELDGLLDKVASGTGRLLPIWHKLTKDELQKLAPSLGQVLALNTSTMSTDDIVKELKRLRDIYRASSKGGDADD